VEKQKVAAAVAKESTPKNSKPVERVETTKKDQLSKSSKPTPD